jgi:LPXTG-motif cell wall-anchored protein
MKKITKLFLGLAGISAVSAGLAIGVVNGKTGTAMVKANYAVTAVDNPGASYSTKRIWVINNNNNFYNDSAKMAMGLSGGVSWTVIKPGTHKNYDGQYYYFFDVPLATTKFKLLRCSSDYATCWGEIGEVTSIVPSVIYFVSTDSYGSVPSTGDASSSKPDAYLMGAVLSAYLTCNSSTDNGYGAVTGASSLTSTWYKNYAGDVNGTLSSVTITDYAKSSSTGGTYSGTKTESVSVARKWEGLSIMAANSGNWVGAKAVVSPATNDSSSTLVLGGIAGVAVLAAGGYFFVRKKKVD